MGLQNEEKKDLELKLERIATNLSYTVGHLYVNDEYFCDVIENPDRGLRQEMGQNAILEKKKEGKAAIPIGRYKIAMDVKSPKFSQIAYYKSFCDGMVPRLVGIPGFEGILMVVGSDVTSSGGSLVLGYNRVRAKVVDSQTLWEKLMKQHLLPAKDAGVPIWIKVTSRYGG